MSQVEVVFCGQSLYVSGLASGLQSHKQMRVVQLESDVREIREEMKMLHPDIIIFEFGSINQNAVVEDFLQIHPQVLIMGLNSNTDSLTVFSQNGQKIIPVSKLKSAVLGEAVI